MPRAAVASPSVKDPPRGPRGGKRERILDAAIKVFARHGYHRSRVADIAREAQIAYGLVYHYFKNKEEILNTIFEERWSGFLALVDEIAKNETSTHDKLLSVAALVLGAYRQRPDWVKVLVLDIQRSSRFAEPTQLRAVGRLFQSVTAMLRAGQARGELRDDVDADLVCQVFMGALDLVITSLVLELREAPRGEPAQSEYYREVAGSVVEILWGGLGMGAEPGGVGSR